MGMEDSQLKKLTIGVVPGTGRMGSNLARNYAAAGFNVWMGSRDAAKAQALVRELQAQFADGAGTAEKHGLTTQRKLSLSGGSNQEAAASADVIFWCITGPLSDRHTALRSLQEELRGKIIIDVTNIMYTMDESSWGQTSATLDNQKALGVPAHWTCAWKSTFWKLLEDPPSTPHCTFVCGDDPHAIEVTKRLVEAIKPFKAIHAGGLKNSKLVELLGPKWIVELDRLNCGGTFRSGWQFGE